MSGTNCETGIDPWTNIDVRPTQPAQVKDLIAELQKFHPETEVMVASRDAAGFRPIRLSMKVLMPISQGRYHENPEAGDMTAVIEAVGQ